MVLRSGWDQDSNTLLFDAGKMGFLSAGHSHADYLHFDLAIAGHPVLVDIGTASYHDMFWRNYCRGTSAHNTVCIDHQPQVSFGRSFKWQTLPERGESLFVNGPFFTLMQSSHNAYMDIQHTRTMVCWGNIFFLCLDSIDATSYHHYGFHYHFHPQIVTKKINGQIICSRQEKKLLAMQPLFHNAHKVLLTRYDETTGLGCFFHTYGKRIPTWTLTVEEDCGGSIKRGMLLVPGDGVDFVIRNNCKEVSSSFLFCINEQNFQIIKACQPAFIVKNNLRLSCDYLIEQQLDNGVKNILAIGVTSLDCQHQEIVSFPLKLPYCLIREESCDLILYFNINDKVRLIRQMAGLKIHGVCK
jgi:hypothetical protein